MEQTPTGTPVGVDDPYTHVERCDHLTDDGRCRVAIEGRDPGFARGLAEERYRCPAADPEGAWAWRDCPQLTSRSHERECARCGLAERRMAHTGERPLLQEHHLVYPDDERLDGRHEITVCLCRWCHAKVHKAGARVDDEADPDPEALAALAERRERERAELGFETAAERRDGE
jgi:hypothetical protein